MNHFFAGSVLFLCLHQHDFNIIYVPCVARLDQQCSTIPCQGMMLGNQWRELENMKAQFVSVNGIRKVACVVCSTNMHHLWTLISHNPDE